MNEKVKIVLSVISVSAVLSFCACGSKQEENVSTNIWDNSPEVVHFSTEPETTYKSCEEPFSAAYRIKLKEIGEENGGFTGAYVDKSGNPVAVESYTDEEGHINFFVSKFKEGKVREITLETDMKKYTTNNNLLIDKNSDVMVLRYYIDKETIRQIIYDYDGDDYAAMRDSCFGYDDTESMEEALKEYYGSDMNLVSFSDKAVTDNIDAYLEKILASE